MSWIEIGLYTVFGIYVFWDQSLVYSWVFMTINHSKELKIKIKDLPFMSVLLPVRNEIDTIENCLTKLSELNYPKEKIEIIVGDDDSTDGSSEIIEIFCERYANFKKVFIASDFHDLGGKSKVIAQLAHHAKGEWLVYTDADSYVPKNWLHGLLLGVKDEMTKVVIGVTTVQGKGIFSRLQSLDWIFSLSLIKLSHDIKKPITGLGNNMMVRREAYLDLGGYEAMEPSIVEDQQLVKALCSVKGNRLYHVFNDEVLVRTKGVNTLGELFEQRKRWMVGAFNIPLFHVSILVFNSVRILLFLIGLYFDWRVVLGVLSMQFFLRMLYFHKINKRILLLFSSWWIIPYEMYNMLLSVFMLVYYKVPRKIDWKGRHYGKQ